MESQPGAWHPASLRVLMSARLLRKVFIRYVRKLSVCGEPRFATAAAGYVLSGAGRPQRSSIVDSNRGGSFGDFQIGRLALPGADRGTADTASAIPLSGPPPFGPLRGARALILWCRRPRTTMGMRRASGGGGGGGGGPLPPTSQFMFTTK